MGPGPERRHQPTRQGSGCTYARSTVKCRVAPAQRLSSWDFVGHRWTVTCLPNGLVAGTFHLDPKDSGVFEVPAQRLSSWDEAYAVSMFQCPPSGLVAGT